MGKYRDDMKGEKKPSGIIPEGLRTVRVTEMKEEHSKKGNLMFVTDFEDKETQSTMRAYLIAEKGKRWLLKSLLSACGIAEDVEGVMDWDIPDVINKVVVGQVVHFEEPWINREGNEVMVKKGQFKEFFPSDKSPEIPWED